MSFLLILFGVLTNTLIAVLIGLIGARRRIGFGWAFLLSVLFTPILGLIAILLSQELPDGERKWGCLGVVLAILILVLAGLLLTVLLTPAHSPVHWLPA